MEVRNHVVRKPVGADSGEQRVKQCVSQFACQIAHFQVRLSASGIMKILKSQTKHVFCVATHKQFNMMALPWRRVPRAKNKCDRPRELEVPVASCFCPCTKVLFNFGTSLVHK